MVLWQKYSKWLMNAKPLFKGKTVETFQIPVAFLSKRDYYTSVETFQKIKLNTI